MKLLDVLNSPWAIDASRLAEIRDIYLTHLRGEKIDLSAVEARLGQPLNNERRAYRVANGTAVVSLHGVLAKRANMFTKVSGGASMQIFADEIAAAAADPEVRRILLDVDSPGGTVDGTMEAARAVRSAAQSKPVTALIDGGCCSAAYWIASAADRLFISSLTDLVGSIGVVATHTDISRAEEKMGVKTTEITAGRYKRAASEYAPLTDEGRASIQAHLDQIYSVFVESVAQHRGVSTEDVLTRMADGRVFIGQQAIDVGLVDGVATLADLLDDPETYFAPAGAAVATQEHTIMTLDDLKTNHPDLVAQIEADATAAAVAQLMPSAEADLAAAVTAERDSLLALHAAIAGDEAHAPFAAAVAAGLTAAQVQALGGFVKPAANSAAHVLAAIKDDEPVPPVQVAKTMTRAEFNALSHAERAAATRSGTKITD